MISVPPLPLCSQRWEGSSNTQAGRRATKKRSWFIPAGRLVSVTVTATCLFLSCTDIGGFDSDPLSEQRTQRVSGTQQKHRSSTAARGQPSAKPSQGRWHDVRRAPGTRKLTASQGEAVKRLESIAYLSGSRPGPDTKGVTVYDKAQAYEGLNLYVSGHAPEAILMDMEGTVIHRWSHEFDKIWPKGGTPSSRTGQYCWRRAHLFENGDLLTMHGGSVLIKLDKHSNLLWAYPKKAHHDFEVMQDGTIYVLTRRGRIVPSINKKKPVLEDFIVVLDANGNELKEVSVLECLQNADDESVFAKMPRKGDILHTNTIEVLDGRLMERDPAFKTGNILISSRTLDVLAIVDLEKKQAVWTLKGTWRRQHQPTVLANGNMLLFDNRGTPGESRVIEFDPITGREMWTYAGTPDNPFFSKTIGSSERLPNGNTLITESDNGRAFEATPDHTIVWEFVNPHRAGDDDEFIATLFEVVRLESDFPLNWLTQ